MYGHKFISQFGDTPDDTWVRCLEGITPQEMAKGLELCLEAHTEWPPGAVEFAALCRGENSSDGWRHRGDAYKPFDKSTALEHKPKPTKKGLKMLSDVKNMF